MSVTKKKSTHTAWTLCGDWFWVGKYLAYTTNGRVGYEDATAAKGNESVKFRYLDENLHQVTRYIYWNTVMVLKPIKE